MRRLTELTNGVAASLFSCDSIRLWNLIRKFVPKIEIVYE